MFSQDHYACQCFSQHAVRIEIYGNIVRHLNSGLHNVTRNDRYKYRNKILNLLSAPDGLTQLVIRTSEGTVMTRLKSRISTGLALEGEMK